MCVDRFSNAIYFLAGLHVLNRFSDAIYSLASFKFHPYSTTQALVPHSSPSMLPSLIILEPLLPQNPSSIPFFTSSALLSSSQLHHHP